ncbi:MAG: DUF7680 family protein [Candidatus Entotheonellia bacterium]
MERFRLRVRHEPKRGQIWELHLFPQQPHRPPREADGRILGSSATPEAILWLRQCAGPYLSRAEAPSAIAAEAFGPRAEPRWLKPEDGMRLALAFSAARWLTTPQQRRMFREGLEELPSEVVLYWFTLCFYGYRQSAGRAALRTLLTHEEPAEKEEQDAVIRKRRRQREDEPTLFPMPSSDLFAEGQGKPSADVASEPSSMDIASVAPHDVSGLTQKRTSTSRETLKGSRTRRRKKGQEEVQ